MIIDFKFKNFLSFLDECSFSMLTNKDPAHSENLIDIGKERLSRTRIIYGANASGKSSFIKAMLFVYSFIENSNKLLEKMPIPVVPFKFCKDCFSQPTEFSITFLKEGIKYAYSFSCIKEKVIDEKLDIYYSAKPTLIFKRTETNTYVFNKDAKLLNELKERNLENKLFLVTSASWNYEKTKPVVDYLLNTIMVSLNIDGLWQKNLDKIYEKNEVKEYKDFCLKLLNNADIGISDFEVDSKKLKDIGKEADLLKELLLVATKGNEEAVNNLNNANIYKLITYHDVINDTQKDRYRLDLSEESFGTVQMFKYSPILYHVFKEGKVLFVDEIDKSLHPILVKYLIKLFLDKEVNVGNAQLIANTHDTNLLDLELFRRDEIWFTERDCESGKTEMYSLAEFSPRKSENIERAYLLGRFGAIPFIKGE